MFETMEQFDEAYPQSGEPVSGTRSLRLQKDWKQWLGFLGINAVILPLIGTCSVTIASEGLQSLLPVTSTRISATAIPMAGMLEHYDGWNKLSIAILLSILTTVGAGWLWHLVFKESMGVGRITKQRESNPVLFYLVTTMVCLLILGEMTLFFFGLEATAASAWGSDPSIFVSIGASVFYTMVLACTAYYHADFFYSDVI